MKIQISNDDESRDLEVFQTKDSPDGSEPEPHVIGPGGRVSFDVNLDNVLMLREKIVETYSTADIGGEHAHDPLPTAAESMADAPPPSPEVFGDASPDTAPIE